MKKMELMQDFFLKKLILIVFQTNIQQTLTFMQNVQNITIPCVFLSCFEKVKHNYPTCF